MAEIYNPPAEVCMSWDHDTYEKFFNDCRECMSLISPIFRKDNRIMSAVHWDEGVPPEEGHLPDLHAHDLGVCKDQDGRYCGNLIDAKLLVKINSMFPKMMRERGWADMADLIVTDFERAKVDADYKAERDMKRGESGLSVNRHLFKKANQMIDEAVEIQEALRERELAVENREQAQQELILLGRRSKSLIEDNEEDDVLPRKERRLPNIDF